MVKNYKRYQSKFEITRPSDLRAKPVRCNTRLYSLPLNHLELEMVYRAVREFTPDDSTVLRRALADALKTIESAVFMARGHKVITGDAGIADEDELRYKQLEDS